MSCKPKLTRAEIRTARSLANVAARIRDHVPHTFLAGYLSGIRDFCGELPLNRRQVKLEDRIHRLLKLSESV